MITETSNICHLPTTPFTVLRIDYLIICGGNYCAAKILSLFEGWSKQDRGKWLYNSLQNIRMRLLGEYSISSIRKALNNLKNNGFIQIRRNPQYKWDRTKQYLLQTEAVQSAIYKITPSQLELYSTPTAETLKFLDLVNLTNGTAQSAPSREENYQIESPKKVPPSATSSQAIPKSNNKESDKKLNNKDDGASAPQHPTPCIYEKEEIIINEDKDCQEPAAKEIEQPKKLKGVDEGDNHNISESLNLASNSAKPILDSRPNAQPGKNLSQSSQKSSSSHFQGKQKQLEQFKAWKQEIKDDFQELLQWKSEQAPAKVTDRLGWAYNYFKADLERARFSFESWKLFKNQGQSRSDEQTKTVPNFEAWELEQHKSLAREYIAKNVAFLKEKRWHKYWVEFVNDHIPNLYAEVAEEMDNDG